MSKSTLKIFSSCSDPLGAFDFEGLTSKPIQEAAEAVRAALSALEGAEESVFHSRMRVLRVARQLELWKLDLDPEVDQPFATMRRWIQALWPKSYRYCVDAWEMEEALEELPMGELVEITGANLKVLKETSPNVRRKKAVLAAAKERTQDSLKEYLTERHDQHFEPVRLMPKAGSEKFEVAVSMVMTVEECNRAEAMEKIATLIVQEYAAAYEHCEKTA